MLNAVVLWNTRYMSQALDHLRAAGLPVDPADVARLWPLGHRHVNVHGRYTFMLVDPVARGQLRPLRDPADPEEYELALGDAIG